MYFFPQSENLYTCVEKDRKITIEPEKLQEQKFVVFGMRPCDVKGVQVLDKVFLADPVDTFYAARREHGTIVSLACGEPEETCFCKVFGVDCTEPETAAEGLVDVAAWFVEDTLYLKAVTEKGTALLEAVKDVLTEAENTDEAKVEAQKETVRAIVEKLPYTHLSLEGWNGDDMMERFKFPLSGRSFTIPAWPAVPAPSCALPVSAMISKITIPDMASSVTAAGIPACTPTLR